MSKYRIFIFTSSGNSKGMSVECDEPFAVAMAKRGATNFLIETKAPSVRFFVSDADKEALVHEGTIYRDPEKQFVAPNNTAFVWRDTSIRILNNSTDGSVDVGDLLAFAEHYKEMGK